MAARKGTSLLTVLAAVGFTVGLSPAAAQTVIFVDASATGAGDGSSWADAYTAVQPALSVAQPGDQVWVAAGTYVENITLALDVGLYGGLAGTENPATFNLADRDLTANQSILDGNQADRVVTSPSGATTTTRIDGFTIIKGRRSGVYCYESSPTIANNRIAGNASDFSGGGGGVFLQDSCSLVTGNDIRGNCANHGGGMYVYGGSPTIANNVIAGNVAEHAGGLFVQQSGATIVNNTIVANGGLYGYDGGLTVVNSSATIANSIIAFNSSGIDIPSGGVILRHNCVYGNDEYNYSGIADPTGTDGNISADPLLDGRAYGHSHIHPDSPCVDAGDNAYAYAYGNSDVDGQPRIQPAGGLVDIGAAESDGTVWPVGPRVIVRVSPTGNNAHDGSSWDQAKRTVQAGINAAFVLGGEVWVESGTYYGRLNLRPFTHVYGGFAGGETQRDERDWTAYVTTLDGQQQTGQYGVVTAQVGYGTVGTIDGFTITNGKASFGGAVFVSRCSPTIANNRITGNSALSSGGAMCVQDASPRIANNAISENTAYYGAGLYLENCASEVTNNTITANDDSSCGGGIYLVSSSPTIEENVIAENRAGSGGGLYLDRSPASIVRNTIASNGVARFGAGMYLLSSSPVIADNMIVENVVSDQIGPGQGGGLYLSTSSPTIVANTIMGNIAGYGGGAYVQSSSPLIDGNRILGNSAQGSQSTGGGLHLARSDVTLTNNTIQGNSAGDDVGESGRGGGLYLDYVSASVIANNTITSNSALDGGGGVFLYQSASTIANCIVAFNSSGLRRIASTGTATLRHNCVFGNTAYNYSGLTNPTGTDGNISVDPRLADQAYGNAHIQPDSPCRDAGDSAHALGDADVDGQPRILPADGVVDIGADESDGTTWPAGPYVIVRVSPAGDDANDGSTWALAKQTVQAAVNAASPIGGEVWVQTGRYEECITLHPFSHLYGGFSGAESERHQRDSYANVTTLDGRQQGSVITARAGYGGAGVVDGFTITNGLAEIGGGLYIRQATMSITNNVVRDNTTAGTYGLGGGLFVGASSSMIANNLILANQSVSGGGLGMAVCSATVANNTIRDNIAVSGGGLAIYRCSPLILNNAIVGNSSSEAGGLIVYDSSATIANNTITRNTATGIDALGGGLYLEYGATPTIANTVIAFNTSGIYRKYAEHSPVLQHNCVFGNDAFNHSGLPDPTGTDGNISVDPRFVQTPDAGPDGAWGTPDDDPGNVHLLPSSPGIDAGDNAFAFGDFDLDGLPRIAWCNVDMGAHEYQGPFGDFFGDCTVDLDDYALFEVCLRFSGPDMLPPFDECVDVFDFDLDFDVDLTDFAVFQLVFTQP
ncbi:MAG: right-handed parallel beta-helix repeat-containing protein [Phycisphaerae bacterium]|nr:right-handed parallel beta-helix repeat-containing protein [Phycisphaerae bacterium]